jgi:hypothetical protein
MIWIKMRTDVLIHCDSQALDRRTVIKLKYSLRRIRAGMLLGDAVFFIRYNWTLPLKAQFAVCMALIVAVLWVHGANTHAEDFATLHHKRCLQQRGAPAPKECVTRTIQLASRMHGLEFGGQVAEALRWNVVAANDQGG